MLRFSRLFLCIGLFLLQFSFSFAGQSKVQACGQSVKCADGYYCSGAVGQAASGVCVANGVSVVTCRFYNYINNDILKYIAIFASIAIGVYILIGKFTNNIFMQVIFGLSVMLSATSIISDILGEDYQRFCSKSEASQCLGSTTGNKTNKQNTLFIYNLVPEGRLYRVANDTQTCNGLECIQAVCSTYKKDASGNCTSTVSFNSWGTRNDRSVNASSVSGYMTASLFGEAITTISQQGALQPTNFRPDAIRVKPADCKNDVAVPCSPIKGYYARDYYACKHCSQSADEFFIEYQHNPNINTCAQLFTKIK